MTRQQKVIKIELLSSFQKEERHMWWKLKDKRGRVNKWDANVSIVYIEGHSVAFLLPHLADIKTSGGWVGLGAAWCRFYCLSIPANIHTCDLISFINCEMLVQSEISLINWDFVEEVEVNRVEYKSALTEAPCLDSWFLLCQIRIHKCQIRIYKYRGPWYFCLVRNYRCQIRI